MRKIFTGLLVLLTSHSVWSAQCDCSLEWRVGSPKGPHCTLDSRMGDRKGTPNMGCDLPGIPRLMNERRKCGQCTTFKAANGRDWVDYAKSTFELDLLQNRQKIQELCTKGNARLNLPKESELKLHLMVRRGKNSPWYNNERSNWLGILKEGVPPSTSDCRTKETRAQDQWAEDQVERLERLRLGLVAAAAANPIIWGPVLVAFEAKWFSENSPGDYNDGGTIRSILGSSNMWDRSVCQPAFIDVDCEAAFKPLDLVCRGSIGSNGHCSDSVIPQVAYSATDFSISSTATSLANARGNIDVDSTKNDSSMDGPPVQTIAAVAGGAGPAGPKKGAVSGDSGGIFERMLAKGRSLLGDDPSAQSGNGMGGFGLAGGSTEASKEEGHLAKDSHLLTGSSDANDQAGADSIYRASGGAGSQTSSQGGSFGNGGLSTPDSQMVDFGGGRSLASADAVTVEDPEDYFGRMSLDEDLFRKVHVRYQKISIGWGAVHRQDTIKAAVLRK